MTQINSINNVSTNNVTNKSKATSNGPAFSDRLKSAMTDVNVKQHVADDSIEQVIQDKLGVHEGMLAVQEADISLRLLVQVRTKVMEAYKEIMHMPV